MKAHLEETADAATTVESLRLELERCQRELNDCHNRLNWFVDGPHHEPNLNDEAPD
jgi:hypothetical protein